ncbi:MAG: RloB family protein [Opitutales bacterium]|nr:RloB family protein [Opitutales bacterium]
MSTHRRKGFRRKVEFEERNHFIVISMEGAETEPKYFGAFCTPRDGKTQIKLVPNPNHKSNPKDVLQRLKVFFNKKGYSNNNGDKGWMVIDRDSWTEDELNQVHRQAREAGFSVALSNPCFELWLYLHLHDWKSFCDRGECQRSLAELLCGYSSRTKGGYDVSKLMPGVKHAINRARSNDLESQDLWPRGQTTKVYLLVQQLLDEPQVHEI